MSDRRRLNGPVDPYLGGLESRRPWPRDPADDPDPPDDGPCFTCPRCGRDSWHPEDAVNGYCGACHAFTADPQPDA